MRDCSRTGCSSNALRNSTYCFEHYKQLGMAKDGRRPPCPPALIEFLEEHVRDVERVRISRMLGYSKYTSIGSIMKGGLDHFHAWDGLGLGKMIMKALQDDLDQDRGERWGKYKITMVGRRRGRLVFERSKHIDMRPNRSSTWPRQSRWTESLRSSAKEWAVNNG